jgi:hypothetical protein
VAFRIAKITILNVTFSLDPALLVLPQGSGYHDPMQNSGPEPGIPEAALLEK